MIQPDIEDLVAPDKAIVINDQYGEWIRCEALVPYHGMLRDCRKDAERRRGKYLVCTSHAYSHEAKFRPETD